MPQLQVSLSAESVEKISWPRLSQLQGWGSLTVSLTGKFVYMTHHLILLRLNPFDLSLRLIGRDGGSSTLCLVAGFVVSRRCWKRFLALAILFPRMG